MDTTNPNPVANSVGLSTREIQLLGLAWQCFKTQPEIDIQRLAQLGGYTHPGSARNALSKAKNKIFAAAESASAGDGTINNNTAGTPVKAKPKAKAASPRKRKQKAAADDNDDDEAGQSADQNAKPSRPKSRAKKPKMEEEDVIKEEEQEEEPGVLIKQDVKDEDEEY